MNIHKTRIGKQKDKISVINIQNSCEPSEVFPNTGPGLFIKDEGTENFTFKRWLPLINTKIKMWN